VPVFLSSTIDKQQRFSLPTLDKEDFNLTLVLYHLNYNDWKDKELGTALNNK
jgi:hypothetical protein